MYQFDAPIRTARRTQPRSWSLALVGTAALVLAILSTSQAGAQWLPWLTKNNSSQTSPGMSTLPQAPAHPAVARIIVPEQDGTSYGSGTLIDVRGKYGLVVTNWHVVRDAAEKIEVVFPDGFRSFARALKLDRDWDLAALVIWRPQIEPVIMAPMAPRPGDVLTIAGHGRGTYRAATGRCTQYLAPGMNLPQEMVELNVEARQGDSGGPIFNERGELAGVLFGAGRGTTMGSYAGRVRGFLASVVPDPGSGDETMIAAGRVPPVSKAAEQAGKHVPTPRAQSTEDSQVVAQFSENPPRREESASGESTPQADAPASTLAEVSAPRVSETQSLTWSDLAGETIEEQVKTVLALCGVLAIVLLFLRVAGG